MKRNLLNLLLLTIFGSTIYAQNVKEIKIGNSVWMAENLKVNIKGSYPYNEDSKNVAKYGMLYTWEAAKNACPLGWHLPSEKEWDALIENLGGPEKAGKSLKPGGVVGFNAPLSGISNLSTYMLLGTYGAFWTSTGYSDTHAWYIYITSKDNLITTSYFNKNYGLSVRCVKN